MDACHRDSAAGPDRLREVMRYSRSAASDRSGDGILLVYPTVGAVGCGLRWNKTLLLATGIAHTVEDVRVRTLGYSGLQVSEITYGNWRPAKPNRTDESKACVQAALDAGITTFDTADIYGAPSYGEAEEILGATLSGATKRESVQILTKVYAPSGPGPNDRGLSRKHIMESCTASLRRLQTDYLDLYQAHRFDDETPLDETILALADLVRAGKILYVGVSEWTAEQIHAGAVLAKELHVPLISNQPQYSLRVWLFWRDAEMVRHQGV